MAGTCDPFLPSDESCYEQMQGKSEFLVTGNLKNWERWDRLREIKTGALTIGVKYDEMDPNGMVKMAKMMASLPTGIRVLDGFRS
jgi:proline iminopeptidase